MPLMIPKVTLPGTTIRCSRFIFGTAALFNVGSRRDRLALLTAAVDSGLTHFDTAPLYGFGWAERDVGALLRVRPQATITSKVGIYAPGGESSSERRVFARKALGKLVPWLSRAIVDLSLERARRSLDASLRRLGADHIHMFMLHEPCLELLDTDEWRRWLEAETKGGRIGAFGLALKAELLKRFLDHAPELAQLVQVLDSLDRKEADCLPAAGRPLQITYGYLSAARVRETQRSASDVLSCALARNSNGAIIVSTTKSSRLSQYAALSGVSA